LLGLWLDLRLRVVLELDLGIVVGFRLMLVIWIELRLGVECVLLLGYCVLGYSLGLGRIGLGLDLTLEI
jgi:hypothetical protein